MGRLIFHAFQSEMDTGLHYRQQIVSCTRSKRLVKALTIGFS